MQPDTFVMTALRPAFYLLPGKMDTREANAFIVAIALQESGLKKRRQLGAGPARSYLQFEKAGIRGVLKHQATTTLARDVCVALDVAVNPISIHRAMEFQDVLAVCFARLLLWTVPLPLPTEAEVRESYAQYLTAWRPGKPREKDWAANYQQAWDLIKGAS